MATDSPSGRWPNLLIIGAHKAGTTSLHRYLDLHPEIRMSRHKELVYFVGPVDTPTLESSWHRGAEWYRSNFVGPEAGHGESSTAYTDYPRITGVPERIHDSIPGVRLIYAVRDPIDRFLSHYMHVRGLGRERRDLADLLRSPELFDSAYLLRSCYWLQLQQYLGWFDPAQILIVPLEDLVREREQTLARIFRFVGVADDFRSERWAEIHNPSRRYPILELIGRHLDEPAVYRMTNERRGLRRLVTSIGRPQPRKPTVPEELWAPAKEVLAADAARLREYAGRELQGWSV